jgi:hypothetical protein
MGLDIYLRDINNPHDDVPSDSHPEHFWKRTYLRSSYNEGGFNRVVSRLCDGRDLYWVFGGLAESYESRPLRSDLERLLVRAEALRTELYNIRRALFVTTVAHYDGPKRTDAEAVAIAYDHLASARDGMGDWYHDADGEFFINRPPRLVAAVPGANSIGCAATHLVYEARDDDWRHYLESADILVEFVQHALTMGTPVITWSS